ncbi:MAG TPA: S1 RNA-binding domain-containing protein [Aggregatilineales bacterium]|nr:S1 RNA-binding domain-containing protein [Aggregatilineales bacterium]
MNMNRINSNQGNSSRKPNTGALSEPARLENVPPPPDESYWSALLSEGEDNCGGGRNSGGAWEGHETGSNLQIAPEAHDWEIAQTVFDQDQTIELTVIGFNRGGLLVEWNSLRGFVPASQLVSFPAVSDSQVRRNELSARVGQKLLLRVIELDRVQNRLILSERAAQVQPGTRADILSQLRKGDMCKGFVTNLCDFGAFIDLGGIEGLIHISELSWGRVGHPRDMLNRGDEITVYVMDVNRDKGRVALSIKRLQPDPWETVESRYQVGQIVDSVITNVVDFGAFACVEEGLEGLIHVSELAEGQFLHPRNVVKEGEHVRVRILNIDGHARRLGLSLRKQETDLEASAEHPAYTSPVQTHPLE